MEEVYQSTYQRKYQQTQKNPGVRNPQGLVRFTCVVWVAGAIPLVLRTAAGTA
jgi:hypothetical protein